MERKKKRIKKKTIDRYFCLKNQYKECLYNIGTILNIISHILFMHMSHRILKESYFKSISHREETFLSLFYFRNFKLVFAPLKWLNTRYYSHKKPHWNLVY